MPCGANALYKLNEYSINTALKIIISVKLLTDYRKFIILIYNNIFKFSVKLLKKSLSRAENKKFSTKSTAQNRKKTVVKCYKAEFYPQKMHKLINIRGLLENFDKNFK